MVDSPLQLLYINELVTMSRLIRKLTGFGMMKPENKISIMYAEDDRIEAT